MRFLFALASLLFLTLLVSAETSKTAAPPSSNELLAEITKLPTCITLCITRVLPQTKCALSDLACLCDDETYAASSQQCILASCTIREALLAQGWQYKACPVPEHNDGPFTVRLAIAFLVLTALCVGGRFVARWRIQNATIGMDDWSILVSYILFIPATVLIILMAKSGMGRDIWTVPADNITTMLKTFYITQYFYQIVVSLTKISIVLLYLRIFPKEVSRTFNYVGWTVIGGLILYFLAFAVVFIMECQPISHFWNQWDGEHKGYCVDIQTSAYVNGAINIFFDLVVFFLPIPKLVKLQVQDTRRKVGVILTFLVGLFVTACSAIRLQYLANVSNLTNATYHYNHIGLWTGLEAYLGIVCACMPSILGPLVHFFRKTIDSKLSSGSKSGSRSQHTHDKSGTRLGARSVEPSEEIELAKHAQKRGEAEKMGGKSLYDLSGSDRGSRDDDMELVIQSNTQNDGRNQYGV